MSKRDPKLRYLQRLGYSWYVRVTIPPSLRQHFNGQTHVRRALHTKDLDEANARKWSAVALIKKEFSRLKGLTVNDSLAARLRAHIRLAERDGHYEQAEILEDCAVEEAEKIEKQSGNFKKAKRFYDLATTREDTLDELHEQWLAEAEYIESTKQYHRAAYREFREFLEDDALPSHIDDKLASEFINSVIKQSGQAISTQRKKVISLSAFWGYLQAKLIVPRSHNPFKGHKLSNGKSTKQDLEPRPFTDNELIALFSGLPKQKHLGDLMILGLYTGARISPLCSLTVEDITEDNNALFINIKKDKTRAGKRTIAVIHEFPISVIRGRLEGKTNKDDLLFNELHGIGIDKRLSTAPSLQFTRYRRKVGVPDGTDFHSFRRTFITLLENLDIDWIRIARYVGHEIPTLAHKTYSGGSSKKTSLEVAKSVRYSEPVEKAVSEFLERLRSGS
jgi:integrase